jgi:predicted PurR-regulated permease PerM
VQVLWPHSPFDGARRSQLQIVIMSRTVHVNPLVVLLSVLLGVELFGIVGALLSVPLAGAVTVVAKELWRHRPAGEDQLIVVTHGNADS